jgi:hypothetical protein
MIDAMRDALSTLARRMPRVVREHEVLRVAGSLRAEVATQAAQAAIHEVLKWVQKRSGGRLPSEALRLESFDYFSGGRNSSCVTIKTDGCDIWAIRADDPDKTVPERVWTTEVVIGHLPNEPAKFSARLLVSTPEDNLYIEPHTPGFVQQVATGCALFRGRYALFPAPTFVDTDETARDLIAHLLDTERALPTFVVTLPDDAESAHPTLDVDALSRAMLGLAHIAVVTPAVAWALTERFGKFRSVFGGAVRVYLPGFDEGADPYLHRLVLANQIDTPEGAHRCQRWMRQLAAEESLRTAKLGRDVLAFASIRDASFALRQELLQSQGASDAEQLKAAQTRLSALQIDVERLLSEQEYYVEESEKERRRAELAEQQAGSAAYRIQTLTGLLTAKGVDPNSNATLPTSWEDVPDWCDENLTGLLVLTASARRGVKKTMFEDTALAVRCLFWLAKDCRSARIDGGDGSLRDVPIEEGVRNAYCGGDAYDFDWSGRKLSADWHVKNGGNTRDPFRCLRIYYTFDEQTQQIIVSDLPAHRYTDAS